jgi:thiamine-monophosphate kinase
MVEGIHFRAAWLTPKQLGRRAVRAAISDVAAMGGRPRWLLLSLELPAASFSETETLTLVKSVAREARECGAALVGGNVSAGPRLAVTISVVGEGSAKPPLRSAARPGDLVFVTGSLGGAAAGWRALSSRTRPAPGVCAAYRLPPLRVAFAAALAEAGLARAMIDVSDGLLQDLGHVADESQVAIRLDPSLVPVHRAALRLGGKGRRGGAMPTPLELALGGGEDYELAFTARPSARAAIEALAKGQRTPVTVIGVVAKGRPAVTDPEGCIFPRIEKGFDHLRRASPGTSRRKTR